MHESVEMFLQDLELLQQELFPSARLEIVYRRLKRASIRMHIDANSFIDIYCNTENGRFDFSLIRIGKRIFGYDNLSGWHYHPADNPECHIYCEEPDMRQIFEEIASVISSF